MKWDMKSGIQRKYLRYTLSLLLLALLLSSIGVWIFLQRTLTETVSDKYAFMNEKMGISLDNMFQKSDEVLAECIMNEDVQKSLKARSLEEVEKNALSKYFAYIDLDDVAEYCYVDNAKNVYTRSYSKISYQDFEDSGFKKLLGDSYAETKWIWTKDTLFGTGEEALFIGRYVHSMEYAHEPGMLFLKMNPAFLNGLMEDDKMIAEGASVGIIDESGRICMFRGKEEKERTDKYVEELIKREGTGMIATGVRSAGGVLSAYRQEESGFAIFILVPDKVLTAGVNRILFIMVVIYLLVMMSAVVLSIYFSRRFTRPIKDISQAMSEFDGKDFDKIIQVETHTELDQIGRSYNEMLGNIKRLLEEIKMQERELRTSELNMLISQINPHFLYNTLDTIYMLARINGEETTMKMIQALSKYLRLSLSKGSDIVTVEDELENVKSYMEIQQIRNENLFRYEVDCQVDSQQTWILKLILQPLVENAIKYGFCEIYKDGLIRIEVKEKEKKLILAVFNSGLPMERETAEKINALNGRPLSEVKKIFPDKRHGYGVVNVVTRLRLKYGEGVQFSYETTKEGTWCIIQIPDDGKENKDLQAGDIGLSQPGFSDTSGKRLF